MEKWKTDDYFVSPYNFMDEVTEGYDFGDVEIHDITLRDGEQQAGVVLGKEEKIEIAKMLDDAGVQRIEVGMPIVSDEDSKAVQAIVNEGLNADLYVFGRCMKRDVDLAVEHEVDGLVMEIPSSDHVLKYAYDWSVDKAIKLSVEASNYAHEQGLDLVFFTIDSTRAKFDTFWGIVNEVIERGYLDSYALIDTFGVCTPRATEYLVKEIKSRIDKPIEIHAHNDFGLGVANSISAAAAGAKTIHTTVNGIGERCGNADIAEVVANLELLHGVDTGIDIEKLRSLSKYVEKVTGVEVPPQKGIVGDEMYTTESGIVTSWWEKVSKSGHELEVYPIKPEFVGAEKPKMVLGKGSGKASIKYKLKELDREIPSESEIGKILNEVKKLSIKKKGLLSDDEFIEVVNKITG